MPVVRRVEHQAAGLSEPLQTSFPGWGELWVFQVGHSQEQAVVDEVVLLEEGCVGLELEDEFGVLGSESSSLKLSFKKFWSFLATSRSLD